MRGRPAPPGEYHLFDTAVGVCGIAWNTRGVTRLRLPDSDRAQTERRFAAHADWCAGDPPAAVALVVAGVQRYLDGARVEFGSAALDLAGVTAFRRKVYEAARRLAWGQTVSYGELARLASSPGAARAVGQALANNPVAIVIPCHRILGGGQTLGGFTAYGGTSAKELLLALEGVRLGTPPRPPARRGRVSGPEP